MLLLTFMGITSSKYEKSSITTYNDNRSTSGIQIYQDGL